MLMNLLSSLKLLLRQGSAIRGNRKEKGNLYQGLAFFVHCLAQNLNLCLQNYSPQCLAVKNALNLTSGVATIIRASPKRLGIFKHLQEEFNVDAPGLKPLCPTRWTVLIGAINSILKNYTELEQASNKSGDSATHASGYSALMENFNGEIAYDVF